jgi:exodeoxyribonuclease VII small subunit
MPLSPNPEDSSDFETTFGELQHIVEELESANLDLERVVRLYDRGTHLVEICQRIVDEAEQRVTRLSAESASPLADAPADDP